MRRRIFNIVCDGTWTSVRIITGQRYYLGSLIIDSDILIECSANHARRLIWSSALRKSLLSKPVGVAQLYAQRLADRPFVSKD